MSTTTKSPIHLHALQVTFLLDEVDTNGQATVFEIRVPTGSFVPPPHSHNAFEETVYGLAGVFTFTVDGQAQKIAPGEALFIARGQIHQFDNTGGVDGAFLSVATPGIFRPAYFLELAELLDASAGGPPDRAAFLDIMRRHGLTPAVPGTPPDVDH